MLSIPHLIVIFVIVLVVFGPQKLPELARGLGRLMAELRKASTDFRLAFEEEMRDLERQAQDTSRKLKETAALPSPAPEERSLDSVQSGLAPPAAAGEVAVAPAAQESATAGSAPSASLEKTIHDDKQPL
jgi:sec-independent protein translocase protein TatB